MSYGVILADPPWRYENHSETGSLEGLCQYPVMTALDIERLPVEALAARNCVLLLWATAPKLPVGLQVMEAWGFDYRTKIVWGKINGHGNPRMGLGYRVRGAAEDLLIGIRGNVPVPPPEGRPLGLWLNGIGTHSSKPDWQYEIAEAYPGPYLELFHRPRDGMFPPRPEWTFLGNEVDGRDIRDALPALALTG